MKEGYSRSIDDVISNLRKRKCSLKSVKWTFCLSPIKTRTLKALTEIIGEWLEKNYGSYPRDFAFEFEDAKRLKKLKVCLFGKNETRTVKRVYGEILKFAGDWEIAQIDIEINVENEGSCSSGEGVGTGTVVIKNGQLYQSFPVETVNSYLRLYSNGDFMLVSAMGNPDDILKWLKPGGKQPVGKYRIEGSEIIGKLTVTLPREPSFEIDIRGKFTSYGIVAQLRSSANNSRTTVKYKHQLH